MSSTSEFEPPVPEASPALYTKERLQKSLTYAERCLGRRDISPRSELFLQLYKDEVKDALEAGTTEQRENHAKMIMAEEKLIQVKRFLRPIGSTERAELQNQLLQLRELEYLVRYGDYMKIIPTRLKLDDNKHKSEYWQLTSAKNYWSQIAIDLKDEEAARKKAVRLGTSLAELEMPTTGAIYAACGDLGISKELALRSIQEYGVRNREVHRDLDDLKRGAEFALLATILCTDRNELSSTFSLIKSETELTLLRTIIQSEIDTWFDKTHEFPNHPGTWDASAARRQFFADAIQKANKPSKEEIKQANIARSKRQSEEKTAWQKEASIGSSSLAGKKRIASTEEPRGSERETQKRTRQQRYKLIAQKCKLEEDLKRVNDELSLFDEDDVAMDEGL